MTFEIFYT